MTTKDDRIWLESEFKDAFDQNIFKELQVGEQVDIM